MCDDNKKPKITYSGISKDIIEEEKEKGNKLVITCDGIFHTGSEVEKMIKEMSNVRKEVFHQCIEKETANKITAKCDDQELLDLSETGIDEELLSVYFLDGMGLLRYLSPNNIPFYVIFDDQNKNNHIHPDFVYVAKDEEVLTEPPKGYMFIASSKNVTDEMIKRNEELRDKLNGGAN